MTINYKIWDFPSLQIQEQLFHVPGSYFEGGLTSGGAKIMSPEPGGRSILDMKIALQVKEYQSPFSSWLMSKINGEIFRIQLTKTPQLVSTVKASGVSVPWDNNSSWDNSQNWLSDGAYLETSDVSLEGQTTVQIETGLFGEIMQHGHVIGIGNHSYLIDDIEYNGTVAVVSVKPPLRKNVSTSEMIFLQPYFLGTIANGSEIRNAYQSSNVGHIQLNSISFNEVIL